MRTGDGGCHCGPWPRKSKKRTSITKNKEIMEVLSSPIIDGIAKKREKTARLIFAQQALCASNSPRRPNDFYEAAHTIRRDAVVGYAPSVEMDRMDNQIQGEPGCSSKSN
ncbi:hypothetical protein [Saccharospirillum salsuginis]|uniref:hypothetical protein n=1 Tax=Saccharospirillum salsuginis TaxID=418750 RepID=UPI0016752B1F|nr:hypothetical protein [Saccharospirillum salsuginis]